MEKHDRIPAMIAELKTESEKSNSSLSIDSAKQMILLSECITAALHAFLFQQA